jgi:hypothetical protein
MVKEEFLNVFMEVTKIGIESCKDFTETHREMSRDPLVEACRHTYPMVKIVVQIF